MSMWLILIACLESGRPFPSALIAALKSRRPFVAAVASQAASVHQRERDVWSDQANENAP